VNTPREPLTTIVSKIPSSSSVQDEVRYWTGKFRVETETLKQAVKKVGPMSDAVERELNKQTA
jgi:hypothetical protein